MIVTRHIIFGLLFSILLYPFFGSDIVIIFLASFIFDIDHIFWYVFKYRKKFSLKNCYKFYMNNHREIKDSLNIFHTMEFFVLLIILSIFFNFFLLILIGFGFHYLLDMIDLVIYSRYGKRAFSLIGWLKRNVINSYK